MNDNLQGLSAAQESIKVTQLNIIKSRVPNARRVDSITSYNGRTGSIDVVLNRATNPFLENLFNKSITTTNDASVINDSLSILQNSITDPQNKQKSGLFGQVETFINTARQLIHTPTTPLKQVFISKGENLAKTISDATNKILDLRMEADSNLGDALLSVNDYISQLFHLNVAMSADANSNELLDQRDNLISKISEFFEVKVSFGVNNNALISTADGSLNLIDSTTYAGFNYTGVGNRESFLMEDPSINSITADIKNAEGYPIGNVKVTDGSDSSMNKIRGGKINGYIKLRDDILLKAGEAIASLSSQVINTVNAVHNKYSPFPPKTRHISTKEVSLNDVVGWNGKLTIAAMNNNGSSLTGNSNSGAVRPISIDLNTLSSRSPSGNVTISEFINEINAYLSTGPADNRLALGQIAEVNNLPPPPQAYLLNNIKLAGMSDIDAAGNFSFDLELDGNQYFGSKVEILSVTSNGVNSPNLPQIFELGVGEHARTGQQISVGNIAAVGPQNIDVRIRVIGDNGVIDEGTARFTVNPALPGGTQMVNKRVSGAALAGNIRNTGTDTYAPIAVAKLVDDNGVEIDPNLANSGKLVIETRNNNNGLMISSDMDDTFEGFSNYFGMNNFFKKGNIDGTFTVDESITGNPLLLSVGTMKPGNILHTVAEGNGVAASASMLFNNQFGNNSTVAVNGVTFTFVNALVAGNPNQILIGVDLRADLTNLQLAINRHPELSSIINANYDALANPNTLTVNSKILGTSSNIIPIAVNLQGGSTVDITPGGGAATGPVANVISALNGGTDTNVQKAKFAPVLGNEVGDFFKEIEQLASRLWDFEANSFVPESKNSILGYAQFITELLSNQLNTAKANYDVAQNVREGLATKLQNTIGIDKDKEIVKLSEFAQSLTAIIAIQHLMSDIYRQAINTLKVN